MPLSDYTLPQQLQITTELLEEERRRSALLQQKLSESLQALAEIATNTWQQSDEPEMVISNCGERTRFFSVSGKAEQRLCEITNMGLNGD